MHVRLLRFGLHELVVVDEVGHDAELAELILERAVGVHAARRVAVRQNTDHDHVDPARDRGHSLRALYAIEALVDEITLVLVNLDVRDRAVLFPHTTDSLVDVAHLRRQRLGVRAPCEDLKQVSLLVELNAHRLGREVLVGAWGVACAEDAHLDHLELAWFDLFEDCVLELQAVRRQQLLRLILAKARHDV